MSHGGFGRRLDEIDEGAQRGGQEALAWLLRRSPNILLIPGTGSVAHLHENLAAGDLVLPAEASMRLGLVAARH